MKFEKFDPSVTEAWVEVPVEAALAVWEYFRQYGRFWTRRGPLFYHGDIALMHNLGDGLYLVRIV